MPRQLMRWVPEWRKSGTLRAYLMAGLTGAVVAVLLFVVASGLLDVPEMLGLFSQERLERLALAVTQIGTVSPLLEWAILLGITSTLLVRRAAR